MSRLDEARLALMLLTRLPAGQIKGDVPDIAAARWAFALTGLPVALIGWGALSGGAALGLAPLPCGFAALAAMALATGGLHHDGLADMADAAGGRDRAHRLEIMRDSRVGSFGVLALVMVCGLGASALSTMPRAGVALMLAAVISRLAMVLVLALLPPARAGGLGASAQGGGSAWLPGAALALLLALPLGWAGLIAIAAATAAATLVAWRARTTLGGQTGDVLGAVQICSETAAWLALNAAF
ncbi:adenosylcobinamide-GDP ribazoletransferase [Citreicella sp. C3M06]|uniref:adenosylcobinamide-GDP ribazoletransferase n=1 Tax=Citreicella sp. C3M06 TaxID=2841564 RepID=UPI00352DF0BE